MMKPGTTEVGKMLKRGGNGKLDAAIASFRSKSSLDDAVTAVTAGLMDQEETSFLKIPLSIKEETLTVSIELIIPFKGQPRDFFDEGDHKNLKVSIKKIGQLEKIKVIALPDGKYLLIDGERRYRAQLADGVKKIKVEVRHFERPLTDDEIFLLSSCFNSNRVNHNPYENVRIVRRIIGMDMCKHAKDAAIAREISIMLGYSIGTVNYLMSVARGHKKMAEMIDLNLPSEKRLKFTSAVHISFVKNRNQQLKFAKESVEKQLSVRGTQMLIEKTQATVRKKSERPRPSKLNTSLDAFIRQTGEWTEHLLNIKSPLQDAVIKAGDRQKAKLELQSISERVQELADSL